MWSLLCVLLISIFYLIEISACGDASVSLSGTVVSFGVIRLAAAKVSRSGYHISILRKRRDDRRNRGSTP